MVYLPYHDFGFRAAKYADRVCDSLADLPPQTYSLILIRGAAVSRAAAA